MSTSRLMSCGRTCPGIEVLVVDESGKEVEARRPGELVARGANVMRGYWNNSQETALRQIKLRVQHQRFGKEDQQDGATTSAFITSVFLGEDHN